MHLYINPEHAFEFPCATSTSVSSSEALKFFLQQGKIGALVQTLLCNYGWVLGNDT